MKRRWIAGLLMGCVLGVTACAGNTGSQGTVDTHSVSESDRADSKSEDAADASAGSESTSEASSLADSTGSDSTSSSSTVSDNSEESVKQEVILSNSQELTQDYTSMAGIMVEPGAYIAVVAKGTDSAYWNVVEDGAKQAIKDLNTELGYTGKDKVKMTFEGPGDNSDVDTQINTIDAVLAENPSVLCISAIDVQSCDAQLETAEENGIPVVIIDSGVQSDQIASACATNNYAAGQLAAKKLCESIGDAGQVAIMAHQQTAQSSIDRVKGFKEEITANHPGVTIVQESYENKDSSVEEMIESTLADHTELAGYFCTNESTSEKTLEGLASAENTSVRVVGFDAGEEQIQAVTEGTEYGIVCQNPYGIGYASMVSAARLAAKLPVDTYISSGFQWIDQTNIDLDESQIYLYK